MPLQSHEALSVGYAYDTGQDNIHGGFDFWGTHFVDDDHGWVSVHPGVWFLLLTTLQSYFQGLRSSPVLARKPELFDTFLVHHVAVIDLVGLHLMMSCRFLCVLLMS